jgi:hypothetical protein
MDVGWELRVVGRHLGKHLIEFFVCDLTTLSLALVLRHACKKDAKYSGCKIRGIAQMRRD